LTSEGLPLGVASSLLLGQVLLLLRSYYVEEGHGEGEGGEPKGEGEGEPKGDPLQRGVA